MTERGDRIVEGAAERAERAAEWAASGPAPDRAADELRDDAAFLRRLKPSLIRARLRGEAPTDLAAERSPAAPSEPQVRDGSHGDGGGPSPVAVVAAAFVLGIVLAKLVDWRSHAHPRG